MSFDVERRYSFRLEHLAKGDLLAVVVRDLDANRRLARNPVDQNGFGAHGQAQIVGKVRDLRVLHPCVRFEFISRHDGTRMDLHDAALDREFATLFFQQPGAVHQLAFVDLAHGLGGVQKGERRQRILAFTTLGRRLAAGSGSESGSGGGGTLTFGGLGGAKDLAVPNAGADAAEFSTASSSSSFWATSRFFGASGTTVPFFVCLAITSRRCFSRRRSSRHSLNELSARAEPPPMAAKSAPKKRPNENWVDMMIARKIIVRIAMTEPVRLR